MPLLDRQDLQRVAIAAAGGLLLGTAAMAAPAHAADAAPLTTAAWQTQVEGQIDRTLRMPEEALAPGEHVIATVSVRFDTGGRFDGVRIVRSTGLAALDREGADAGEADRRDRQTDRPGGGGAGGPEAEAGRRGARLATRVA